MKHIFLSLFFIPTAFGATCQKLSDCVELGAGLSNKKILFNKKIIPPQFELNRAVEMDEKNVETALNEALIMFGLAKVPTGIKDTFKIIEARDIRFNTDLPRFEASLKKTPELPVSQAPVMLVYEAQKGIDTEGLQESLKPLLSRYGKVTALRSGSIVVADLSVHVKKLLPLIQKLDFPLTPEEKERQALEKKRQHELEIARLRSGEAHEIGPHKHQH